MLFDYYHQIFKYFSNKLFKDALFFRMSWDYYLSKGVSNIASKAGSGCICIDIRIVNHETNIVQQLLVKYPNYIFNNIEH